jgi:hypothetical protein
MERDNDYGDGDDEDNKYRGHEEEGGISKAGNAYQSQNG